MNWYNFFYCFLIITGILFFTGCQTTGGDSKLSSKEAAKIRKIISSMTLEEKIGQLFIVEVRTGGVNRYISEPYIDYQTKQFYNEVKPGGYILFAINCKTPDQTKSLIENLNSETSIPPFIAVDEEGGIVARIANNPAMGQTRIPSPQRIGNSGDPENAYIAGLLIGEYLYQLGFNVNLAPVADVNTNPYNHTIATRSFGTDPEKVGEMAAAFNRGLRKQKIVGVYKHFPGQGDSPVDTHNAIDRRPYDLNRLLFVELIPFEKGVDSGAEAILTAHIAYPVITGDTLPATLSPFFLKTILRKRFGYNGLILTDSLTMGAISKNWPDGKAALMSFLAGSDILLIPGDLHKVQAEFLRAVNEGELSEERIDQSLFRILSVKSRYGILEKTPKTEAPFPVSDELRYQFYSSVK